MNSILTRKEIRKAFTTSFMLFISIFLLCAQSSRRLSVPNDVSKWITSSFAKGTVPPLSFIYNGQPSSSFIRKWKYSLQEEKSNEVQVVKFLVTYTDPKSGLKLECHIKGFNDFKAVEWVLNFTNTSGNNSSIIEQVNVVDFTAMSKISGKFSLFHAKGSNAKRSDFRPLLSELGAGETIHMQPSGGRSSDETGFPFFTLESPEQTGFVAAIGWSGNWFSTIEQTTTKATSFKAGMANMKLFLYPGETIRTPSICMLFWQSKDHMDGQNQFRRFILAHHSRKINGKMVEYPLSGGFNWGDPHPCSEYSCLTEDYACALINRYKQFGITPEVFWLDAGWYPCNGTWNENVGNWVVDTTRFPNGLKPVSNAAHKVGAKFMLWFEPERARVDSKMAKEHPEWMLHSPENKDNYLVDLGNPEALNWISKYFGDLIEQNGVDYYRQDFNVRPTSFWKANEEPGRTGINEIRYIEGLYKYWDYLLERFPNLVIDNCASGGRRIDLGTISRSAPLWRTDYNNGEPNGSQCHTYGLNFFLPLSGTGVNKTDDYSTRSTLGSAVVLNWKLTSRDLWIPYMQKFVSDFKELRPYFYEDYYPLTGLGDLTGDDVWLAYQMNKPSDNSGIVIAFRRKDSPSENLQVKLRGLNPGLRYTVYNDNDKSEITKTGKELSEGITLEIKEIPGSLLLKYYKN